MTNLGVLRLFLSSKSTGDSIRLDLVEEETGPEEAEIQDPESENPEGGLSGRGVPPLA